MVAEISSKSGGMMTVDFPCDGQTCDTATLAKNKGVGKVLSMNTCAPPNTTAATAAITEPPRTPVAPLSRLPYRVCLPIRLEWARIPDCGFHV